MPGDQSVNDDGCADQWERHECKTDFWTREILGRNRADLGANRDKHSIEFAVGLLDEQLLFYTVERALA